MRWLLTPRWLLRHALTLALVVAFLWLARWQIGRATGGNTLSWAYALEWPLFAGFVVLVWVRMIRDELRAVRTGGQRQPDLPPIAPRPAARVGGLGGGVGPAGGIAGSGPGLPAEPEDPELAAYNRYLAWLNANPDRHPREYPG